MKNVIRLAISLGALALGVLLSPPYACAQGNADVEAKFIGMLKGTWAPVQKGRLGGEKGNDSYRIARVEKTGGDKWTIVSIFNFQGRQIEYPIPANVKFAGDTAVLILDNVKASPGDANWSARVMFFDDVYTGRW